MIDKTHHITLTFDFVNQISRNQISFANKGNDDWSAKGYVSQHNEKEIVIRTDLGNIYLPKSATNEELPLNGNVEVFYTAKDNLITIKKNITNENLEFVDDNFLTTKTLEERAAVKEDISTSYFEVITTKTLLKNVDKDNLFILLQSLAKDSITKLTETNNRDPNNSNIHSSNYSSIGNNIKESLKYSNLDVKIFPPTTALQHSSITSLIKFTEKFDNFIAPNHLIVTKQEATTNEELSQELKQKLVLTDKNNQSQSNTTLTIKSDIKDQIMINLPKLNTIGLLSKDSANNNQSDQILIPGRVWQNFTNSYQNITIQTPLGNFLIKDLSLANNELIFLQCNVNDMIAHLESQQNTQSHNDLDTLEGITASLLKWLKAVQSEDSTPIEQKASNSFASRLFHSDTLILVSNLAKIAHNISSKSVTDCDYFNNFLENDLLNNSTLSNKQKVELQQIYHQTYELNKNNDKWSFFPLPLWNEEMKNTMRYLLCFINKDKNFEEENYNSKISKRFVVQMKSKNHGDIWIDTLFQQQDTKKKLDIIIRCEKIMEINLKDSIYNLFTSISKSMNFHGNLLLYDKTTFSRTFKEEWRKGIHNNTQKSSENISSPFEIFA